ILVIILAPIIGVGCRSSCSRRHGIRRFAFLPVRRTPMPLDKRPQMLESLFDTQLLNDVLDLAADAFVVYGAGFGTFQVDDQIVEDPALSTVFKGLNEFRQLVDCFHEFLQEEWYSTRKN